MAISKLLQAILVLSLIPVGAYAVTTASQSSHTPASLALSSLSITAGGNATAIGSMEHIDDSRPELSDLSLPVSIPVRSEPHTSFLSAEFTFDNRRRKRHSDRKHGTY